MLNTALTVVEGTPESHLLEWNEFTDEVIRFISAKNNKCAFLLLGKPAKAKSELITQKNKITRGTHPLPQAANQGFFGSNVFKYVEQRLGEKIDWSNE